MCWVARDDGKAEAVILPSSSGVGNGSRVSPDQDDLCEHIQLSTDEKERGCNHVAGIAEFHFERLSAAIVPMRRAPVMDFHDLFIE